MPPGFDRWNNMNQMPFDMEPLVFKSHQEFLDYVQHPDYEIVPERPGICWGYEIDEDISSERAKKEGPKVDISIYVESRDGRTPSQGPGDDGAPVTS